MGQQVSRSALSRVVADNLRRLRAERQLSEAELAMIAQISAAQVRRIEQQHIVLKLDTLERLARALAVSPGDLFAMTTSGTEHPRPQLDAPAPKILPQRRAGIY